MLALYAEISVQELLDTYCFCSLSYDLNVEKNAIYKMKPVGYEFLSQ